MRRPQPLHVYIAAVATIGLAAFVVAVTHLPVAATLALLAIAAVAESLTIIPRPGLSMSLGNVIALVGLALYGPAGAIIPAAGQAVGSWRTYTVTGRDRLMRIVFNFGQWAIAAGVAAAVWKYGWNPDMQGLSWLLPLAAAAATYTSVNLLLVFGVMRITTGEGPRSLLASASNAFPIQLLHVGFAGMFIGIHETVGVLGVALMGVPFAVSHVAMRSYEDAWQAEERLLNALVMSIEVKDGYTSGHGRRVGQLAGMTAEALGLDWKTVRAVRVGGLLHDIGKIAVPLAVLRKPAKLTEHEYKVIQTHPTVGAQMLDGIDWFADAIPCVEHHHERMDGAGYPAGLAGEQIPLSVRIVSIADAFDAMTTTRAYRRALPADEAFRRLESGAGTQFDADLVEAFIATVRPRVDAGLWEFPQDEQDQWSLADLEALPDGACGCCPPAPAASSTASA